jgi:hypothetical protein
VVSPTRTLNESEEQPFDDETLARENAAIEKILNEASEDLKEVKRKAVLKNANSAADGHLRDVFELEDGMSNLLKKLDRSTGKLNQLDFESDLRLRQDLVSMEIQTLEAEAATLISRGDTLVLLIHRSDVERAEELQKKVAKLRAAWQDFKRLADGKTKAAQKAESDLKDLRGRVDALQSWLRDAHSRAAKFESAANKTILLHRLMTDSSEKAPEFRAASRLFDAAKKEHALKGNEVAFGACAASWDDLQAKIGKICKDYGLERVAPTLDGESPSTGPTVVVPNNRAAAEIVQRISKMREAVSAIDRQLRTQVLSNKQYENLPLQAEALETAKNALEKLRPTMKMTAKDLESLTGSLTVEYLEKIVAQR